MASAVAAWIFSWSAAAGVDRGRTRPEKEALRLRRAQDSGCAAQSPSLRSTRRFGVRASEFAKCSTDMASVSITVRAGTHSGQPWSRPGAGAETPSASFCLDAVCVCVYCGRVA